MIQPTGQNLVFLLSTPRAGSTLLSAILSNHARVLCPNEPWFLLGLNALYHGGNLTFACYEHGGVETALRDLLSAREYLDAARAFAVCVYNRKLSAAGRSVLVDKTPRYYHILSFIDELFPEARKIWLQRNPLDVVASYQTSWQLTVDQLFDPGFGPMGFDLTLGLARFAAFFRGQPNAFEIRYEDLVRNPRPVLERLCAFLGVASQPDLEHYGADPQALAERKSKQMGDTNVFAHARPHTQSLDRWETVLTAEQIQKVLDTIGARFFERMGYGDTVQTLRTRGFRFPEESAVEANLRTFEESARALPWAHRERDQLLALGEELRAERDRLREENRTLRTFWDQAHAEKEALARSRWRTILCRLARWRATKPGGLAV